MHRILRCEDICNLSTGANYDQLKKNQTPIFPWGAISMTKQSLFWQSNKVGKQGLGTLCIYKLEILYSKEFTLDIWFERKTTEDKIK